MDQLIRKLNSLDAHHRVVIAAVFATLVGFFTAAHFPMPGEIVVVWNAFSLGLLALAWVRVVSASAAQFSETAKLQDAGQTAIFVFVIAAACVSLFAVAYLLSTAKGLARGELTGHVTAAVLTVVNSWCLIHTLFALRYAHIYYGDSDVPEEWNREKELDFPGATEPDYWDFAYFAFVIGMTCQVSDVQVVGRRTRRWTLVHGLLSFGFNTAILALSINLVSGLFTG